MFTPQISGLYKAVGRITSPPCASPSKSIKLAMLHWKERAKNRESPPMCYLILTKSLMITTRLRIPGVTTNSATPTPASFYPADRCPLEASSSPSGGLHTVATPGRSDLLAHFGDLFISVLPILAHFISAPHGPSSPPSPVDLQPCRGLGLGVGGMLGY